MIDWAEMEIELAIQREIDNMSEEDKKYAEEHGGFCYGAECYKSALKAYKCLAEDDHSGCSWGITKNILIRLMNSQPLSPITDEDFICTNDINKSLWTDELLKKRGLKSDIQCPRMTSLFKKETLDGKVTYTDIDRVICYNEGSNIGYCSGRARDIIDEMYPITMPYVPTTKPYKVYTREHLLEPGTFDGVEFLYIITPDGERIELNRYFAELDGEHMVEVSKEDYINFITKDNK